MGAILLLFGGLKAAAQFMAQLGEPTLNEFQAYVNRIESECQARWSGKRADLWLEEHPAEHSAAKAGKLIIQPMNEGGAFAIKHGLVHDWMGAAFIPGTTLARVLSVLQDFDNHQKYFPEIVRSRTLQRNGNTVKGYWRLKRTQIITVVLDVEQVASYEETRSGLWHCRATTTKISEVDDAGTATDNDLPPDDGHGYLWRLNAYWNLKAVPEGVYAECRTLSLSRDIPFGLNFAVKPFIQSLPRASLESTLTGLKKAAAE